MRTKADFDPKNSLGFVFKRMEQKRFTLSKSERLHSLKLIEALFGGNNKSFSVFPLRVVYRIVENDAPQAACAILISVPKKRFKHAVDRNRIKRQIREAYRLNKHLLLDTLEEQGRKIDIGFVWLDAKHHFSAEIERKMIRILSEIKQAIC